MSDTASKFVGDIPKNYNAFLGPNIFDRYGREMAAHVAAATPGKVLELAAGSGIVTRHVRDALPGDVAITASDLNAPMLEVAQAKFAANEKVVFTTADAQSLPFDDNSFDLVFCQFGVMFFPDRVGSYRQAARVIRPGGRYLFSSWGTNAENLFSEIADTALAEFFPDDPPGFYNVPFFYNDLDQIRAELSEAGLSDVHHTASAHDREVTDYGAFAHGLIFGNPAIAEVDQRGGDPGAVSTKIAARLRDRFGAEPSTMPLLAHFFEVRIP